MANLKIKGALGWKFVTNALIPITYTELKDLVDNSKLEVGAYYRITDYTPVSSEEESPVATTILPFDVVVCASSTSTLYDDAKAMPRLNYTYTTKPDFDKWELKFDISHANYAWCGVESSTTYEDANKNQYELTGIETRWYVTSDSGATYKEAIIVDVNTTASSDRYNAEVDSEGKIVNSEVLVNYDILGSIKSSETSVVVSGATGVITIDGTDYSYDSTHSSTAPSGVTYYCYLSAGGGVKYFIQEITASGDYYEYYPDVIDDTEIAVTKAILPVTGFKGCIFYMQDEFNNSACYDFKNILIGKDSKAYTFGKSSDESITGVCKGNKIEEYYNSTGLLELNQVIFASTCTNNTVLKGVYNTGVSSDTKNMTIGHSSTNVLKQKNLLDDSGSNTPVEILWSDLRDLVEAENLVAGTTYKITDYECMVNSTAAVEIANHPFDILVKALDNKTLSEDAKASLRSGDTYFANSDIGAWELKYQLLPSSNYDWAVFYNKSCIINKYLATPTGVQYTIAGTIYYLLYTGNTTDYYFITSDYETVTTGNCYYRLKFTNSTSSDITAFDTNTITVADVVYTRDSTKDYIFIRSTSTSYVNYFAWKSDSDAYLYTTTTSVTVGTTKALDISSATLSYSTSTITVTDGQDSKGLITYMKDEWGNESCFDFKNIKVRVCKIDTARDYDTTCQSLLGDYMPKNPNYATFLTIEASDLTDCLYRYTFGGDTDFTINTQLFQYNVVKPYVKYNITYLPYVVFYGKCTYNNVDAGFNNGLTLKTCSYCTIHDASSLFLMSCNNVTIGGDCNGNVLSSVDYSTIDNKGHSNALLSCDFCNISGSENLISNVLGLTIGLNSSGIKIYKGTSYNKSITIGEYCSDIIMATTASMGVTIGNYCSDIAIAATLRNATIEDHCTNLVIAAPLVTSAKVNFNYIFKAGDYTFNLVYLSTNNSSTALPTIISVNNKKNYSLSTPDCSTISYNLTDEPVNAKSGSLWIY